MPRRLKCKRCNYESVEIDHPYGLPSSFVPQAIKMHLMAYPNHIVEIEERK